MDEAESFRHADASLDDGSVGDGALGAIVLSNDITLEPELQFFLRGAAPLFATRIHNDDDTSEETLRALGAGVRAAAGLLNEGERLDGVLFGCTSASVILGRDTVEDLVRAGRSGTAPDEEGLLFVTNPFLAATRALRALGARKLAVLTPYADEVNADLRTALEKEGFRVVAMCSFHETSTRRMCRISPGSIFRAGRDLVEEASASSSSSAVADALFVSCTSLRVSPVLGQLEQETGVPVVASNQALAWDALLLNLGLLEETLLAIALVYVPFLNWVFGTEPLDFVDWLPALPFAAAGIVLSDEYRKALVRRFKRLKHRLKPQPLPTLAAKFLAWFYN